MLDAIQKDTLKPGDVVGIRVRAQIGWGFFRYLKTIPYTIERITPSRRKYVMTNGSEFGWRDYFYPITGETIHETNVAEHAEMLTRALSTLYEQQRNGALYKKDDDFIVRAAKQLKQIADEATSM